jgi:hypothetical protein
MGPAQLTCPNTDTDHSDQSVPVLFAPLFLKGRAALREPLRPGPGGPIAPGFTSANSSHLNTSGYQLSTLSSA